jgi:methylglyoxal synthase
VAALCIRSKTIYTGNEENKLDNSFITFTIPKQKTIALIAHDGKKKELIDWCEANKDILRHHFLCGTGTTARLVAEKTGLPVKAYNSGPLGGDQQIGAKIVEGLINFVVFFSDPLEAQPHDPDVKALLRIAQVYDIPIANNKATADFMVHSSLMSEEYEHKVINFRQNVADRVSEQSRQM